MWHHIKGRQRLQEALGGFSREFKARPSFGYVLRRRRSLVWEHQVASPGNLLAISLVWGLLWVQVDTSLMCALASEGEAWGGLVSRPFPPLLVRLSGGGAGVGGTAGGAGSGGEGNDQHQS